MNTAQTSDVSDALLAMQERAMPSSIFSKACAAIKDFADFSQLLRMSGAAAIVASLSVFLLQGWDIGNDVARYWLLLTQTVLLTAGGFALSYGLKENKGARLFFGLALASVPANFTILGALIHSIFGSVQALGAQALHMPGFATWQAEAASVLGLSGTLAGALLVLIPVSIFGMLLMTRTGARHLTPAFLLANAALLLPFRTPLLTGLIVCGAVVIALAATMRLPKDNVNLRTPSGRFATALLFVPATIVLARSVCFYSVDASLILVMSLSMFFVLRQISLTLASDSFARTFMETTSLVPAVVIGASLSTLLQNVFPSQSLTLSCTTISAIMIYETAARSKKAGSFLLHAAAIVFLGGALLNLLFGEGLLDALVCLAFGALTAVSGQSKKQVLVSVAGAIVAVIGLCTAFVIAIENVDLGSWSTLAVAGTLAIVLGSVLDRHGATLKLRMSQWFNVARPDTRTTAGVMEETTQPQ